MKTHISAAAIIHLVLASLGLIVVFIAYAFADVLLSFIEVETYVADIGSAVLAVIFTISAIKQIITIIGAIGLLNYKRWGRVIILIASALDLLLFPIGTILGAYSFWALLNSESQEVFR